MKDLSTLWDYFVNDFCNRDFCSATPEPFMIQGYIAFYGDGFSVLVKPELMKREVEQSKYWDSIGFGYIQHIGNLTYEQITAYVEGLPKNPIKRWVKEKCPECNGKGVVEVDYESCYEDEEGETSFTLFPDCPICKGTGRIDKEVDGEGMEIDKNSFFKFLGYDDYFKVNVLLKLLRLMQLIGETEGEIVRIKDKLIIKFGDDVIFMAVSYDNITTQKDVQSIEFNIQL